MAKVRIAGFTDDFSGALSGYDNGPGDYSTMAVSGGLLQAAATGTPTGIVRNTGGYSPDQYSKITINNITGGAGVGNSASAFVRHAGGTTEACYLADVEGDTGTYRYAIYEVDNAFGFTQLSTNGTGASLTGPVNVTIEAEGTALRLYSDEGGSESLRTSTTDATLISGRPGCGIFVVSSTTASQISDFECGSLWESIGDWLVACGPYTSGTANISPETILGHAANDYLLCLAHSAGGENIVLGTANGFSELTDSPSATGATTAGVKVAAFGQLADSSSEVGPTITDPGDHCGGRIMHIRHTSGAPTVGVTNANQKASATTSFSISGDTTTADNSLCIMVSGRDNDSAAAAYSAVTNADLSSLMEMCDQGTTSGNGGGMGIFIGLDTTAGSVGATTGTVTSSINANYFISFAPPGGGGGGSTIINLLAKTRQIGFMSGGVYGLN